MTPLSNWSVWLCSLFPGMAKPNRSIHHHGKVSIPDGKVSIPGEELLLLH
jgi:hypothetical protein